MVLLAAFAGPLAAQERLPSILEMHVRVSGSYIDNFLQAPEHDASAELLASSAETRLILRMRKPRLNIHARASRTVSWLVMPASQCLPDAASTLCVFDGFEPDVGTAGGFDLSAGRFNMEGSAGYQRRSPRLFGGDEADFATIAQAEGSTGFLFPGNMRISAMGHYHDVYQHTRKMESKYTGGGGSLRFRGFGYRFSPEIGGMISKWESPGVLDDYDEYTKWWSLRMIPVSLLYLHVRYRFGQRVYATDDSLASNFEREDERRHWTLSADLRLARRLTWGVYYTHESVESTRTGRSFVTSFLTSGLSFRVF